MLADMSIKDFSGELASSSPAPGGGSVAALCGSLSAALVSMVSSLTIGKQKYIDVQDEMEKVKQESESIRKELVILIDRDAEAFNKVMAALKLPKDNDTRPAAILDALKGAAEVPLRTAELCCRALELAETAACKGSQNTITDAGTAALVAHAGLKAAALNVEINLSSIKDLDYKTSMKAKISALGTESDRLLKKVMKEVKGKIK